MAEVTGITVLDVQNPLAVTEAPEGEANLGFANQAANLVLSGPESGAAAYPTFRAIVGADITYTPGVLTDWDGDADPGDLDDAVDQLAERVDDNEILIGTHASRHQNGGADKISVAALSGLLADDQHVLDAEAVSAVEAEDPLDLAGAVSIAKTLTIADTDPTPVDDVLVRVLNGILRFRNSADTGYAVLQSYQAMLETAPLLPSMVVRKQELDAHEFVAGVHHAKYTDAEAIAAVPFAVYISFGVGPVTFVT